MIERPIHQLDLYELLAPDAAELLAEEARRNQIQKPAVGDAATLTDKPRPAADL